MTNKACAYPDSNIIIAVNSDLLHSAPDVVDMLRRWDFNLDAYKTAFRWQGATGVTDPNSTAIWWLQSNSKIWSEWVTAEAAANVQAALDRGETASARPTATPTRAQSDPDRAVLVALYHSTGGASWDANTNWLSDRPIGEWHGVTTNSNGRVIESVISRATT